MSDRLVAGARRAATWACLVWGALSLVIVGRAWARTEFALAAREAREVVAAMTPDFRLTRLPMRRPVAEGRIGPVVRQMQLVIGREAELLRSAEQALVTGRGWRRYVSVPRKDVDQWDVVGAVVLEARWWRGLAWPLAVLVVGGLLAAALARRGINRCAEDAATAPWFRTADAVATMAVGLCGLALLATRHLGAAATALGGATQGTGRFDPLTLPLPGIRPLVLLLALVFLLAAAVVTAAGWAASPASPRSWRRASVTAWGFLAPSALHLALFTLGPLLFTGYLSLHRWDLLASDRPFIGLDNYRELLGDPQFWNALRNTALYSLYVPVTMVGALGTAMLLNRPGRTMRVLRAMVFLPTVVSYVAIAMVWQWIYHADYGLLNHVLRSLGGTGVDWLGNPSTALVALMIVSAWVQLGYQMIVYLAGLQGIPATVLEAATLEGAGAWQRFLHVTWPLLRPVSLYLLVTGIIWSFQVFALVYVMTEGGPARATDVLVYQIYQQAWEFRRMGYASALSWVLFALLLGLTFTQWRLLDRQGDHAA